MGEEQLADWSARHTAAGLDRVALPGVFRAHQNLFPSEGTALEVACGRGGASVWLALRGLSVHGVDISPVAIDLAKRLAADHGVTNRCRFEVHDLDSGLPDCPPVDLLLCNRFRDPRLYGPMMNRLAPGGVLAIAVLSEVGAEPGRFRARPDELSEAFHKLETIADGEADGIGWFVGRRAG